MRTVSVVIFFIYRLSPGRGNASAAATYTIPRFARSSLLRKYLFPVDLMMRLLALSLLLAGVFLAVNASTLDVELYRRDLTLRDPRFHKWINPICLTCIGQCKIVAVFCAYACGPQHFFNLPPQFGEIGCAVQATIPGSEVYWDAQVADKK